jgi:hypothetical protein
MGAGIGVVIGVSRGVCVYTFIYAKARHISPMPALKAQHPEFELWSQGIHARSGVACADCHMPYERVGANKVSGHHVRSPFLTSTRPARPVTNGRKRS